MQPIPLSRRFSCRLIATTAAGLFATGIVSAQDDTAARIGTQEDIVRRSEETAETQRPGFLLSDPELGEVELVSRAPRPKTFTFSTDQNLLYTSNAFLVPEMEQDAFFWNGRLVGSVVPYATRNFTPRITFEQNFFRYDEFRVLDFDSQSLTFDMKYDFRPDDTFFANLSYTGARLYSPDDQIGEFYRYGVLNGAVTYIRPLPGVPVQFAGALGSNWRHGDPSDFDRATVYLNLGVRYAPVETVEFVAFVRPDLQWYLHDPNSSSRTDFNFSTGVSASWTPIEYFTVGLTASFTGNYSSVNRQDYNVFLPSLVLAGRASF